MSDRVWRGLAAATVALAACTLVAPAVGAEDLDSKACLVCHGTEGFGGSDGAALFISADTFGTSVHAAFPCTVCHADATSIPHAEELAPPSLDTCAVCHADPVGGYRQGIHGRSRSEHVAEAPTCEGCHGDTHAITSRTEPTSTAHWSNLAKTCAQCHAQVELAEKFRIPVVRPVEAYLQSAHARAVAAGRRGAVCSDCHRSHLILPSDDPRSSIAPKNVPDTCGACHGAIAEVFRRSVHGESLERGVRDAPTCTDCHGEHQILAHNEPASPIFARNIPADVCGRCHGDTRLSQKYGIATEKFSAFQDSFHGLALRAGQLSVANCASCHGVHDIRPASDPESHVSPANLPATCGKCHPGAGERFALGPVHILATERQSVAIYWIRVVYVCVIVVVIGFMVLHAGLDLWRKARHARPPPPVNGVGPERMSRILRWQHGLVMLCFPILVYSGFALTYPESWWAKPLLRWEGAIGLRGLVHRVAAGVLLASLLWHAVALLSSPRLRACLAGLRWSWDDVRQFGAMLAHYAGRRARPRSGKFGYVEKVEYWAFLWGMVVMSLTGFVLWSADVSLRYLPKWVTDVATAIHFYEAVLAALAILVWHLYWVIFDPDVYPMDWAWWDGQSPPSRVLERTGNRPEEQASPTSPGATAAEDEDG